jgi:nucleoside-diphosphate-sugar epimerase
MARQLLFLNEACGLIITIVFNILERTSKVNLKSPSSFRVIALVTGGTGFIGSHLVELLLEKNYSVRCLVRTSSDTKWLRGLPVEFVYGDLFDTTALQHAVAGVDYVYHAAGLTKAKTREEYYQANTAGTKNILDALVRHNPVIRRFVHLSSQAAVGPSDSKTPITEERPPRPLTTYGKSKWKSEEECLKVSSLLSITIVRPPAVYGPRERDIFEFFRTMSRGLQPIVGFNEKYLSLLHVADVVRGCLMAAESATAAGQTYFISSNGTYGWKEIGDIVQEVMNRRVLRVRIPEAGVYMVAAFAEFFALFSPRPALINFEKARDMVQDYWTCDASKARRDFGFEQKIPLREGIQSTVDWYRKHDWL